MMSQEQILRARRAQAEGARLVATRDGAAAGQRAGKSQTESPDWPATFFRKLDRALGEMMQTFPHLDVRAALKAVLEDDAELADGYRLAMRWLGTGANYYDKAERAGTYSEAVSEMRPALRAFFSGGGR
jgi:hypothetical protein